MNFSYSSKSMSDNHTKKLSLLMIFLSGPDIQNYDHTTSRQMISYKRSVLFDKKSSLDIWNIDANKKVGNFYHVVFE